MMHGRSPIMFWGRRVPPLQGGEGLIRPISQGVALGSRVVAPLARMDLYANGATPRVPRATPWELSLASTKWLDAHRYPRANGATTREPRATPWELTARRYPRANGATSVSLWQCPRDTVRDAGAREIEQAIADNVAEILEAR
jgi:hypothetical protein